MGQPVSELSERKSWQAYTFEAVEFAKGAGGPDMSAEDGVIYEGMIAAVLRETLRLYVDAGRRSVPFGSRRRRQ